MQYAVDYLEKLKNVLAGIDTASIGTAVEWLREARNGGRTVFICGNGGSASIASHVTVDFVKGASCGRPSRFKVMSLADNLATLTAYANDVNYESVFVEPLRNFAAPGDVLIAISGSGESPNVLRAVEYANSIGCRTIGMTRADGGKLRDLVALHLGVPGRHMGRLEDGFMIIGHILTYAFMEGAVG